MNPEAGPARTGEGACYCGRVRLRFEEPVLAFVNCHCSQCRRLSGAAMTSWYCPSRAGFRTEGHSSLTAYVQTEHVTRYFCRHCGTPMFADDARRPDMVGIPAGVVRSPITAHPVQSFFEGDAVPWCMSTPPVPGCLDS